MDSLSSKAAISCDRGHLALPGRDLLVDRLDLKNKPERNYVICTY
jgi:hypothetical protein